MCSVLDSIGTGLERQLLEGAVANSSKAVLAFGTIDVKPVLSAGQPLFFMGVKNETTTATSRLTSKPFKIKNLAYATAHHSSVGLLVCSSSQPSPRAVIAQTSR